MTSEELSQSNNESFINKEFSNFSKFLSKYSIFALAIGTILGQTSKDVVNNLVTGIISPAIALVMPSGKFADWTIKFKQSEFLIGAFLDSMIQMLVSMIVIYIAARYLFRKMDLIGIENKSEKKEKTKKKSKS